MAADTHELLDALRSGDPARVEAAVQRLYGVLDRVARGEVRGKQDRAGFQPDSIIQSVMRAHLNRVRDSASDDVELAAWLKNEVRRKVVDRARHQAVRDRGAAEDTEVDEAAASGHGPSSIVRRREQDESDTAGARTLLAVLTRAIHDNTDVCVVNEYIIDGAEAAVVAAKLGLTDGALRTRASRLRQRALDAVLDAMREDLDGTQWALARLVLAGGVSPASAGPQVGVLSESGARAMLVQVAVRVRARFGARGVALIDASRKQKRRLE